MIEEEDRAEEATALSNELVELIKPVLAGLNPEIVGATLGQLLAILVAGHAPELRAAALELVVDMARDLVPIVIEEMIEEGTVGADWRGTTQ
jgi:hypothetical protein